MIPGEQELSAEEIAQAEAVVALPTVEAPVQATEEKPVVNAPALSEAEQTLEIMATLGLNKDNAAQVVGAARAFQQYGYLIEKDPRQFAKILKTQSPEIYESFINGMTDEYLETHETTQPPAKLDASAIPASKDFLDLKKQVEEITGAIKSNQQQTQYNAVVAGYRDKVEEVVGKISKNDDGTPRFKTGELRAIKAMLRDSLESDPQATQRVYQGNYVDVARHVQKVVKEFTDDVIADNKAEHSTRQNTVDKGKKEVPAGPTNNGKSSNPADSWDNAENALAAALSKGRK